MRALIYWFDKENIDNARMLFEENGHEVMSMDDIQSLEEKIWKYSPDVLLCHCHVNCRVISTQQQGFERIKILTKEVRNKLKNCVIIVTYNPKINARWISSPLFGGRQDHSYLFALLGDEESYTGYEKDFMFPENFLNEEKIQSLNLLTNMIKNKKPL